MIRGFAGRIYKSDSLKADHVRTGVSLEAGDAGL